MQSSESRETLAALGARNEALWAVCFVRRVRVVWESSFGRLFVFGAIGASGTWQQFARIGWLRGTVDSLPRGESVLPFRFRYHPHTISCHFGFRSILASGPPARL